MAGPREIKRPILRGTAVYVLGLCNGMWSGKDSDATNRKDFSNQALSVAPLKHKSGTLHFSQLALYAASLLP